jgi:hypothetical protein
MPVDPNKNQPRIVLPGEWALNKEQQAELDRMLKDKKFRRDLTPEEKKMLEEMEVNPPEEPPDSADPE